MQPPGGQYGPPGWQQGPPPGGPPPGPPGHYPPGVPPPPGGQRPYPPQPPGYPPQPPPPGSSPQGQPAAPPPGYPPQQGHPPQGQPPPQQVALPAQAGAGTGRLVIDASCSWLVWMLRVMGKPAISINGGALPVGQWGQNTVDLPEGQHNVDVVVNYLWPVGRALTVVPVQAGQQTVLYYKAPVMIWSAGALDSAPGGYPGMAVGLAIMITAVVLVLLLSILPALL